MKYSKILIILTSVAAAVSMIVWFNFQIPASGFAAPALIFYTAKGLVVGSFITAVVSLCLAGTLKHKSAQTLALRVGIWTLCFFVTVMIYLVCTFFFQEIIYSFSPQTIQPG